MIPTTLTVKQAAERLGVSAALMYELLSARKIAHERHGMGRGKIVIRPESLEVYRRERTVTVQDSTHLPRPAHLKLKHLRV
jgi:excisionase family DNA binding protein